MLSKKNDHNNPVEAQKNEAPDLNALAPRPEAQLSPETLALHHALLSGLQAIEDSRATLEISEKVESSFAELVTNADAAAQKAIIGSLRASGIELPLLGEEDDIHNFNILKGIIVDPLDGSVNFATGGDQWGLLAARMVEGRAESGVLICPGQGITAIAELGVGTFINDRNVELSVNSKRSVAMPIGQWLEPDMQAELKGILNNAGIRLLELPSAVSAQLAFLDGTAGAYAGLMDRVWDSAAAIAATSAAGGSSISLISQQPSKWEQQKHYPNSMSGSAEFALELAELLNPLAKACSGR